jgi:GGDEF domain-containing protein
VPPDLAREFYRSCPVGILAIDRDGKVHWVNSALSDMLSITRDALLGSHRGRLPHVGLEPLFSDQSTVVVRTAEGYYRRLSHTWVQSQHASELEVHYFVDQTEAAILEQEKEKLQQEVKNLSLSDPATGLLSQRAIMLVLEPEVARSRRYHNPLSVVLLSVAFRDEPGASEQHIGQLLKEQLRWADLIGRDDSGQFVLVLPETGKEAALNLADKVGRQLEEISEVRSFAFGIAEWQKGDNAPRLLRRASDGIARTMGEADAT